MAPLYFFLSTAETLYRHALEICQNTLGTEHPMVVKMLDALAVLYQKQDKYVGDVWLCCICGKYWKRWKCCRRTILCFKCCKKFTLAIKVF